MSERPPSPLGRGCRAPALSPAGAGRVRGQFDRERQTMIEPSPELDTDLLFVYGTLRRGFPLHHHLRRMGAEFVARGNVQGELFDFGKFPGARKSTKPGKTVEGELYRLRRPEKALKVLDQ